MSYRSVYTSDPRSSKPLRSSSLRSEGLDNKYKSSYTARSQLAKTEDSHSSSTTNGSSEKEKVASPPPRSSLYDRYNTSSTTSTTTSRFTSDRLTSRRDSEDSVKSDHSSSSTSSHPLSKREAFFKNEPPSTKFDPSQGSREREPAKFDNKENNAPTRDHHPPSSKDSTKELDGYVGFANLPNQVYRKSVKRGFEFTLMVVGESGLGKSTLINSLFLSDLYCPDYPGPSHRIKKTVQVETTQVLLKEGGVQLRLTIVDTPGFGDAVDNSNCWQPVTDYIESKCEEYLNAESRVNRRTMPDNRVHCCLYFIAPSGHGLKPLDVEFMKRLHDKVNIIPLIAKADTMTPDECREFKKTILNEIAQHKIRIYEFPDIDDEEENKALKKLKDRVPFAVVGSNATLHVNGKQVRGRQYPWGVVEVENLEHNDFMALKKMVVRTHMQDLKDVTNNVHYENYRYNKLASVGGADTKTKNAGSKDPITQMEDEKKEHEAKMKKMEAEMEQVFEMKVKEKKQKLKDSEADLERRAEQMRKSLEQQEKELEDKRKQFEKEKAAFEEQTKSFDQEMKNRSLESVDGKKKKVPTAILR